MTYVQIGAELIIKVGQGRFKKRPLDKENWDPLFVKK